MPVSTEEKRRRLATYQREYQRKWRAAHRETILKRRRELRQINRQKINAQEMLYRQKRTPEQKAAKAALMKGWQERNHESILAYRRHYYAEHKTKLTRQNRARVKRRGESRKDADRAYQREWMRKWRAANPERVKATKQRTYARHRETNRAAARAYWVAHPEKRKANWERWAATPAGKACVKDCSHRRRARKKCVTYVNCSAKIRELKLAKECHWCGCALIPNTVTIDHVVALAQGGSHSPDNLVAACRPCNTSKQARTLAEWTALLSANP